MLLRQEQDTRNTVAAKPEKRLRLSDLADDDMITFGQIQEIFGVSRTTVWRWRRDGLIAPVDLPGTTAFRAGEIKAAIKALPTRPPGRAGASRRLKGAT